MSKNLLIIIFATVICVAGVYFYQNQKTQTTNNINEIKETSEKKIINFETKLIKIGSKEYKISLTKTEEERNKGLAVFESLPADEGMLFSFDREDNHVFWMKDMKFNIDIIFLDKEQKVLEIYENVKAEPGVDDVKLKTYSTKLKSKFVIELKEGETRKNGIKPGDAVIF